MQVAVLGNGGFGTAMALAALRAGRRVRLWGHDPAYTARIAATRRNDRYLDDVVVPPEVLVSADAGEVLAAADLVLAAVPTQHLRAVLTAVGGAVPAGAPVVSLAKGLEQGTGLRPSEVIGACLPDHATLILSGPSHAEEVARGLPTTVVLTGDDDAEIERWTAALASATFRLYRNRDPLGVELCGALKNVMALAAGIADGLGFGDNAKAAILARGMVEMARYGVAEGADPSTFHGLAGIGDLAVTAFSRHGRNRAFGERIGRGATLDEVLASTAKVAEGVWTSRVVRARAVELGVEMPLCEAVCGVLFDGVAAADAVAELMARDLKDEL